jgi:hypothetical protein
MESLESKLDRLSPTQRTEVEDYVDFLLSRAGQVFTPSDAARDSPPVMNQAPPPLTPLEPVHGADTQPVRLQDLACTDDRATLVVREESVPAPFQEIGGNIPDRVSRDFLDYGQFEHPPSPATIAVTNVKRKIIARKEQEKPHHLLDWVD